MFDKNKKIKSATLVIFAVILNSVAILCAALGIWQMKGKSIFAIITLALCAASISFLIVKLKHEKLAEIYCNAYSSNLTNMADIKFSCKDRTAVLSSTAYELTGIETASNILTEEEYRKYISEIISSPYSVEEGIYMSCIPEKWLKLQRFDLDEFECTVITDVSKYVSCRNVIRSLKYYDAATGILSRDAFLGQVRTSSDANKDTMGIIHFIISGIEKVTSFSGTNAADNVILKIAAFIKKYENPHNIFAGRTATNEFSVLMTDTYDDGCRKMADKIFNGLQEMLREMPREEKSNIRIFCGYVTFHGSDNSVSTMMSSADFAAFDAESSNSTKPVLFDPAAYSRRAHEFKKIQVFNNLIANNRIDYHFQPIVNAHTGAIYGYEALMRPQAVDGIKLSPLEMLSIAEQQEMLYEIEHITFFNTLKLLSENQDFFANRKLFINCIPNALLTDGDYSRLIDNYGELFDKVVVEITEGSPVLDSAVKCINERFRNRKAQVALDDYGTGYSNDSTLLSVKPEYIKIDRSIMMNIDKDPQKQHLVSNMINFASQHGITTLGEGIETLEELETAISLGIDLIQGFVACRATAVLMLDIPVDIKNEIINYNLKYTGHVNKTYEITSPEPVDIVNLALIGYTKILIRCKKAVIKGDPNIEVSMTIATEMTDESSVKLNNVNIIAVGAPAFSVCKGADINLELIGRNTFSHDGIRVPSESKLYICGKGKLDINCAHNEATGIGGNYTQDFGQITIDSDGIINISNKGDSVVAIGGGIGSFDSCIKLLAGSINLMVKAKEAIGIGTFVNDANISINPIKIDMSICGQSVVGIGSKNGHITLDCAADVTAIMSGDSCSCIGTLEKGSGNIRINGGTSNITVRGKSVAGIGAINGNTEIVLNAGFATIVCEGDNATCVGDATGSGSIRFSGLALNAIARAAMENAVGVNNGRIYVNGGSIATNSVTPPECFYLDDTPLKEVKVDGKKPFRDTVQSRTNVYSYCAEPTGEDVMNVFLPEDYSA